MGNIKYISLIISLLVVFTGCKKLEESPSIEDTYKFFVSGSVEGRELSLNAGEGDYYMFSSNSTDSNNAIWYEGNLTENNCSSGCNESIRFRFKGKDAEPIEAILTDKRMDYTIYNPQKKYGIQLNTANTFTSRAAEVNYFWTVENQEEIEEKDPYILLPDGKEFYDLKLMVKTSKGVDSEIENRIYTNTDCKTWFEYKNINGVNKLIAHHKGGKAAQYYWEFEDGSSASVPQLDFESSSIQGTERVCLTITDENGCVSQSCQNVVVNARFTFCAANFDYDIQEVLPKNGFDQFHTVEIEYTNPNGEVFYSNRLEQGNTFTVLAVEDFEESNENGQPVKRIQFATTCQLTSLQGHTITLENLTGKIGVAVN
jgi:hypothetical protein